MENQQELRVISFEKEERLVLHNGLKNVRIVVGEENIDVVDVDSYPRNYLFGGIKKKERILRNSSLPKWCQKAIEEGKVVIVDKIEYDPTTKWITVRGKAVKPETKEVPGNPYWTISSKYVDGDWDWRIPVAEKIVRGEIETSADGLTYKTENYVEVIDTRVCPSKDYHKDYDLGDDFVPLENVYPEIKTYTKIDGNEVVYQTYVEDIKSVTCKFTGYKDYIHPVFNKDTEEWVSEGHFTEPREVVMEYSLTGKVLLNEYRKNGLDGTLNLGYNTVKKKIISEKVLSEEKRTVSYSGGRGNDGFPRPVSYETIHLNRVRCTLEDGTIYEGYREI